MSRSRNVPQRTHAPQLAIRSSWLLTKCCGLATTYIVHQLTRIRFELMGTTSVMIRGTYTGHFLVLIWNLFLFHCSFQDRIFHLSHTSQLIGKCQIYQLLKSICRLRIPRTCTGLHRVWIQCMLLTVYQPLDGMYGPHWRHLRCRSSPLLTRIACILVCEYYSHARRSYGDARWSMASINSIPDINLPNFWLALCVFSTC